MILEYESFPKGHRFLGHILTAETQIPVIPRPKEKPSEYETTVNKYLDKIEVEINIVFMGRDTPNWGEGVTDKYNITLSRKNGSNFIRGKGFSFYFYNSLVDSQRFIRASKNIGLHPWSKAMYINGNPCFVYKRKAPGKYDVLACLTKYEPPLDFAEFCSEYGYSDDSIKAKGIFEAVLSEWSKVSRFFSEEELEVLNEIAV